LFQDIADSTLRNIRPNENAPSGVPAAADLLQKYDICPLLQEVKNICRAVSSQNP
jgi:hypothetical protein